MGGGRDDLPIEMLAAARDGNASDLRALLESGVPPDASNPIGQTPMHFASMWGHAEAVSALLDAGADINVSNDNGKAPLFYAVKNGRKAVVRLLLDRGAKVRDLRGMLEAAEGTSCEDELVSALQQHSGPGNEITQAIKALDLDKLRALLDAGKLFEDEAWDDPRGRTPLHHAVLAITSIVEQRVEQVKELTSSDVRLPAPCSRLPTPDSPLPTPCSRLPTPHSPLPAPYPPRGGTHACMHACIRTCLQGGAGWFGPSDGLTALYSLLATSYSLLAYRAGLTGLGRAMA